MIRQYLLNTNESVQIFLKLYKAILLLPLSVSLWTKIAKHREQQQDMVEDRTAEEQRPRGTP